MLSLFSKVILLDLVEMPLLLTLQLLDNVENSKVVALLRTGLFNPQSPTNQGGKLRASWDSSALLGIRLCVVKPSADGSSAAQRVGPPGLGKPLGKPVPGSQGCTCHLQPPVIITEVTALEHGNIYLNAGFLYLNFPGLESYRNICHHYFRMNLKMLRPFHGYLAH